MTRTSKKRVKMRFKSPQRKNGTLCRERGEPPPQTARRGRQETKEKYEGRITIYEFASDSESKFEPRQGRYKVARGGAPKGREPRERVKKGIRARAAWASAKATRAAYESEDRPATA